MRYLHAFTDYSTVAVGGALSLALLWAVFQLAPIAVARWF